MTLMDALRTQDAQRNFVSFVNDVHKILQESYGYKMAISRETIDVIMPSFEAGYSAYAVAGALAQDEPDQAIKRDIQAHTSPDAAKQYKNEHSNEFELVSPLFNTLKDLVEQIEKTNPVDDHGHDLKMNVAFIKAKALCGPVAQSDRAAHS
jgi:hypothetical protein